MTNGVADLLHPLWTSQIEPFLAHHPLKFVQLLSPHQRKTLLRSWATKVWGLGQERIDLNPMPEIFNLVKPKLEPIQPAAVGGIPSLKVETPAQDGNPAVYTVAAGDEIRLTAVATASKWRGTPFKLWWRVVCTNNSNTLPK